MIYCIQILKPHHQFGKSMQSVKIKVESLQFMQKNLFCRNWKMNSKNKYLLDLYFKTKITKFTPTQGWIQADLVGELFIKLWS